MLVSARNALATGIALAISTATVQLAVAGPAAGSPAPVTRASALHILAATRPQADITGTLWQPDAPYAHGGSLTGTLRPIARTANQVLYRHSRVGATGYSIPVSEPGTYFVDLFTSETAGAKPGQRVWTVSGEGKPMATVDVARDAGPATAFHVLFAVPVTDGMLNLRFTPLVGRPAIDAVEVTYENNATRPRTLFDDEFNGSAGTSPDRSRWGFAEGGNGWGNNELQSYTSRPTNASMDGDGNLDIVARQENYTGTDGIKREYTSARLTTRDKFTFQYGTATARVQVPPGAGLQPAFWALGSNDRTAPWPLCGEMDVFEHLGREPNTVHATVHAALQGWTPNTWMSGAATTTAAPVADSYHTFGMVWGPNAMSMSLDGRTYFTLNAADMSPASLWNFNHPFFLLLDMAVGGTWSGAPTAATSFPAVMAVDYVRVTS